MKSQPCLVRSNPFGLTAYSQFGTDMTSTAGKTSASAPSAAGTGTFLIISESTWCNGPGPSPATAYTPTNTTSVLQINPYDQLVYQLADPMLGCANTTGGGITGRLGDNLINAAKYTKFVGINMSMGSQKIADWATGSPAHRTGVGILCARKAGLPITGVIVSIGINDAIAGTSQSAWQNSFTYLYNTIRGMGVTCPITVIQTSRINGTTTSAAIAAAQAAVVGTGILAGPNLDSLTGTNLQSDGIHLTTAGQTSFASTMSTFIQANY